jgi:hypothetical protein
MLQSHEVGWRAYVLLLDPIKAFVKTITFDNGKEFTPRLSGRVTTRRAQLFSLDSLSLDSRWQSSGLSALIVMSIDSRLAIESDKSSIAA